MSTSFSVVVVTSLPFMTMKGRNGKRMRDELKLEQKLSEALYIIIDRYLHTYVYSENLISFTIIIIIYILGT